MAGDTAMDDIRWLPLRTGLIRIPLVIKLPGQKAGRRIGRVAQPWDLAPTVLELFGRGVPEDAQGESLLPTMGGGRRRARPADRPYAFTGHFMGDEHLAQAVTDDWIYAYWVKGGEPPWLLDLRHDPGQRKNVAAANPAICRRLHEAVAAFDPTPFRDIENPWRRAGGAGAGGRGRRLTTT